MKAIWKEYVFALVMGLVFPAMLLNFAVMLTGQRTEPKQETEPLREETTAEETEATAQAAQRVPLKMRLRQSDGTVQTMDMDEYLVGVVLAEMPASFEREALKAQAVVARTYTEKAYTTCGKHGDGSVCTSYACCQAYITESDYLAKGGTQENVEKIRSAVEATSGYVLTYQGSLIEATYFSCSGGSTEDAVAVWGTDYPYLRATDSPGEENAAYYTDTVRFSAESFSAMLGAKLTGSPASWLGDVTYTAGGGVDTMEIGGVSYKGTELRSLLGLRSTAFTMEADGEEISVTTHGFGHRVGMSQYGADAMAASGSSYPEILAHYYQGTTLTVWKPDN